MGGFIDQGTRLVNDTLGIDLNGPSAPQPVDQQALIERQAQLNRLDQLGPLGSVRFTGGSATFDETGRRTGGIPTTAEFQLSPELQRLFDSATSIYSAPTFNEAALDPLLRGSDLGADRRRVEDALYERQSRLLNDTFGKQENQLLTRLSNQGLPSGSEARGGQFGDLTVFNRERNRAFEDAALNSVLAGGAEQSRLLAEGRNLRGQQIQDQLRGINLSNSERARQVNEFLALLGGQQVASPQYNPIDVTGPASLSAQQEQVRYLGDIQRQAAKLGGLTDLGSAAIAA